MGKTLYELHDNGAIVFRSERKAWAVDIPAYVYDLWLPLIGIEAIGLLGVYYRLEREGEAKGLSQKEIARKCRIGTTKLNELNKLLQDLGFIDIRKPENWQKLAHHTTTIVTKDAPMVVEPRHIEACTPKNAKSWEYEPLCTWLISGTPKDPDGNADNPKQERDAFPNRNAKFEPSLIEPLVVVAETAAAATPEKRLYTDEQFAEVIKAYEANIGIITALVSDDLKDWLKEVPHWWLLDVIKEAALANVRNWKYCTTILKRWQKEGHVKADESQAEVKPEPVEIDCPHCKPPLGNGRGFIYLPDESVRYCECYEQRKAS